MTAPAGVRSLGFRTDLALLALGGSVVEPRQGYRVIRTPSNPGYRWGNFLLLDDVPAPGSEAGWLDRFATEFPDAGHRAIGVDVPHLGRDALAGFAAAGCETDAAAVMTARDVHPARTANAEADCRALHTDDDWAQSVELRVRCRDDGEDEAGYRAFAEAKTATTRAMVEAGHGRWFGAFLDGTLRAQLGLFRAGDGLARYQAVETDPAARRQGLAATLLHVAGRWGLDELGARTLVIVADPDYVAIQLYRRVGFEQTETQLQVQRV